VTDDGPTITAIRSTKRDPSRVSIHVDGKFAAALSRERLAELGLKKGTRWTEEIAARVAEVDARDKAMRDATRILGRRAVSCGDLRQRLQRKQHDAAVIDQVIDRMQEIGALDDEAFGRALIREIRNRKPAGRRLLQQKLYQKRLDRKLIDRLLDEADAVGGQLEQVRQFAIKRLHSPSLRKVDPLTRKRRLWSVLARRGFDSETISDALADLPELESDSAD